MLRHKLIIAFGLLSLGLATKGQTFSAYYASIVNQSSQDSIVSYLTQYEDLGLKRIGTPALDQTKDWLIDRYTEMGYSDIVEDTFSFAGHPTANVVVTKQGNLFPDRYLIVDAHYDTKSGPGTNDNGSGTAVLLEVARLFKDLNTEYSIKFIHFSGEEDGLFGSTHFVNNVVVPDSLDILLVLNIDNVGGIANAVNEVLVCERDEDAPQSNNALSAVKTDELATCVSLYSDLTPEIDRAFASDYIPFEDNLNIITGFYEGNVSPHIHRPSDTLGNLDIDYVYQVTRAAVGATLHFSVTHNAPVGLSELHKLNVLSIAPNPMTQYVTVELDNPALETTFRLHDAYGREFMPTFTKRNGKIKLAFEGAPGVYFLTITSAGQQQVVRLIKQ